MGLLTLLLIFIPTEPPPLVEKVHYAIEAYRVYNFALENTDSTQFLMHRSVDYEDVVVPSDCKLNVVFDSIDSLTFPLSEYVLYRVTYRPFELKCKEHNKVVFFSHDSPPRVEHYLVGYKKETRQVMYISGNFFEHRISNYFDLTSSEKILPYLKMKLYKLSLLNLKMTNETVDSYHYTAYSQSKGREVQITVSKNNFDKIDIK